MEIPRSHGQQSEAGANIKNWTLALVLPYTGTAWGKELC